MENIGITVGILIVSLIGSAILGYLAGSHIAKQKDANTLQARSPRLGMILASLPPLVHICINYEHLVGPSIYLVALIVAFAVLGVGSIAHNKAIDDWNKANPDKPPK